MLFLLLANVIVLPVAIAFFNDDLSAYWIVFNCVSDTCFLLDVAINFRTGEGFCKHTTEWSHKTCSQLTCNQHVANQQRFSLLRAIRGIDCAEAAGSKLSSVAHGGNETNHFHILSPCKQLMHCGCTWRTVHHRTLNRNR